MAKTSCGIPTMQALRCFTVLRLSGTALTWPCSLGSPRGQRWRTRASGCSWRGQAGAASFTYVSDDIVGEASCATCWTEPATPDASCHDGRNPISRHPAPPPHRVSSISAPISPPTVLMDYIAALEGALNTTARKQIAAHTARRHAQHLGTTRAPRSAGIKLRRPRPWPPARILWIGIALLSRMKVTVPLVPAMSVLCRCRAGTYRPPGALRGCG